MSTRALLGKALSQEHLYLPDRVEFASLSGWSRWDPRLKLILLVSAIGANVFLARLDLSLTLFCISLGLALWSRIPLKYFLLFFVAPAWATLLVVVGFALGFGTTPLATLGPLTFYREGLGQGVAAAARVASDMGWLAAVFLTTPFNQVLAALRWFRVPGVLVDTIALTYRYALLLLAEFHRLREAARGRGGLRSYRNAQRSLALILTQVFLRAYDRAGRIQEAMIARGAEAAAPQPEATAGTAKEGPCPNRCDINPVVDPAAETILSCRNLGFSYNGVPILQDLNFAVRQGEVIVLCGPNGAGKTTLLKLLSGMLVPTSGEIYLGHQRLDRRTRNNAFRQVGILAQDPNDQLFCTHVAEDIAYGPRNLGLPEAEVERLVAKAMELMEVSHLAARPIHRLSYGEMKRVGLAGLIALRPPLILLDEPTASLDPAASQHLVRLLQHLHSHHGYTFIVVTHDIDLASQIATRIIILNQGRIMADGEPRRILTDTELLLGARLEPPILTRLFQQLYPEAAAVGQIPVTLAEAVQFLSKPKEKEWKLCKLRAF